MKWTMVAMLMMAGPMQEAQDYENLLKDSKIKLAEGVALALKEAKEGAAFKVEVEGDKSVHWAVDVAVGTKVLAVDIDVKTGKVIATDNENDDRSALVKAAKIPLVQAVEAALKKTPGDAVAAEFKMAGDKAQAQVKILAKGKVKTVVVDAQTGEIAGKKAAAKAGKADARPFTEHFPVEEGELASAGRNTYFILEPGYYLILEGKEDGKDVKIQITVTQETKKIAGVETRVVEDKVWENGQLAEVARDYFAISRKTGNVYYFGEDVDNYKDGKVANHDGSWLAGEKDAKFGLQMPGSCLIGARFFQEQAPGVGMDRIEILSLSETFECPAGKFEHCLKTEETSPLEPGVRENKLFAPGVGMVQEGGGVKLVKYGKNP